MVSSWCPNKKHKNILLGIKEIQEVFIVDQKIYVKRPNSTLYTTTNGILKNVHFYIIFFVHLVLTFYIRTRALWETQTRFLQ